MRALHAPQHHAVTVDEAAGDDPLVLVAVRGSDHLSRDLFLHVDRVHVRAPTWHRFLRHEDPSALRAHVDRQPHIYAGHHDVLGVGNERADSPRCSSH